MTERIQTPRCMTVRTAAELLAVDEATVYRWIGAGKLGCYRLGGTAIRMISGWLAWLNSSNSTA